MTICPSSNACYTRRLPGIQRAVADELEAMSLSVESANPARRLYRRLGYETVEVRDGDFLMLKRFGETNEDKP
jgi:ribosomal protein S18 acetylase RimI-like enzyme